MASGQSNGQRETKSSESHRAYWRRVLRPLFWWLLLVLLMYGYRLHQRAMEQTRIQFSVTLNGQPLMLDATAQLDGQPVYSGQKISLGPHTFVITHPKAGMFSTSFFGWYGGRDFGQIRLQRTMGSLQVRANPPAQTITITGPEFSLTLHDSTGTNVAVPTDAYVVRAEFPHWAQSQNATVFDRQAASCIFSPQFGVLHLTCNRAGATYDLQSTNGQSVDNGNLPAIVGGLPVGSYHMVASYHKFQMQKSVVVQTGVNNEMPVEFVMGAARLETVPVGADVRTADGGYLGQTPLDLPDMSPQTAQFNLSLSGYTPVSVAVEIVADQTNSCRTNLVSLRYLSAMQDARQYLTAGNYDAVAQATGEALTVKPNDADALALQVKANGHLNAERERLARLKRPRELFDSVCSLNPDASLFAEHELKTSKPAKDVEAAIVNALKAAPSGFEILDDDSPQPENYRVMARHTFSLGILGGTERLCLLVVGQTKADETQIFFKVLEYQVQHTIEANSFFNIKDNKQKIPIHASRMQMNDVLQARVQEGIKMVTERIQAAIGQMP
jgi:hypothetical protein